MSFAATFSPEATSAYLRTLPAIRERCERVFELGKKDSLQHFTYHADREADVVKFCIGIMQVSLYTSMATRY